MQVYLVALSAATHSVAAEQRDRSVGWIADGLLVDAADDKSCKIWPCPPVWSNVLHLRQRQFQSATAGVQDPHDAGEPRRARKRCVGGAMRLRPSLHRQQHGLRRVDRRAAACGRRSTGERPGLVGCAAPRGAEARGARVEAPFEAQFQPFMF